MTRKRNLDGSVQIGPTAPSGRTARDRIARDIADMLNHLIHLGYDLVGAYELARDRLESPDLRDGMNQLEVAHRRQIDDLCERVRALGVEPSERGDLRAILEKGRVVIAGLRGDAAIVAAMADNERVMLDAYREAADQPGLAGATRKILDYAVIEEERHRTFYERLLQQLTG